MSSVSQIKKLGDLSCGNMGSVECMQTSTNGSYSSQFTSGAKPVVEGGKGLIGNGVYQSKLRTITPVGRRGNKAVGNRA